MCIGRASGFGVLAVDEECTRDIAGATIDSAYYSHTHAHKRIIIRKCYIFRAMLV